MTEDQNAEKGLFRIIAVRVLVPAFALGSGWLLFYLWPPVLLVYLGLFAILVLVAAVGFWKHKH
jgi:hypothetical protein